MPSPPLIHPRVLICKWQECFMGECYCSPCYQKQNLWGILQIIPVSLRNYSIAENGYLNLLKPCSYSWSGILALGLQFSLVSEKL